MRTVRVCEDGFGAELLKGRLINEGIPAMVIHGAIEQVLPYSFGMPSLKPQVAVADEDYPRAMALLEENPVEESVACPYCGSADIAFGMQGGSLRRRIGVWFLLPLLLLIQGPLGKIQPSYYCRACKQCFSRSS